MESLAGDETLAGLDENDPASMERIMKRMGNEIGEDMGDDMAQAIDSPDDGFTEGDSADAY